MEALDRIHSTSNNPVLLVFRRIFSAAKGRPMAGALFALLLVASFVTETPNPARLGQGGMGTMVESLGRAVKAVPGLDFDLYRTGLFDAYQRAYPRQPQRRPVTIVAIDENSLATIGQWPWPRDKLATLINVINQHGPAAIGVDIYMPEPDQTSPAAVAGRLPLGHTSMAEALRAMPSHDSLLAQALFDSPSVLGVAGFNFQTYSTRKGLRSIPLATVGGDPVPFVPQYSDVLASLPELQAAAHGQAMLSVEMQGGKVRRIPLVSSVGSQLVASLPMEMLRVATASDAVTVRVGNSGVEAVQVADLAVPTLGNANIWQHFAHIESGMARYVSARDVLQGRVDAGAFAGKLVLIGMTGSGLVDMRVTALGDIVPGIEIQAQAIEAFFDGDILTRPAWLKWAETFAMLVFGISLIWLTPNSETRLGGIIKNHPRLSQLAIVSIAGLILLLGFYLFSRYHLLFDAASLVMIFVVVLGVLKLSVLLEGLGVVQVKLSRLIDSGVALGQEHSEAVLLRRILDTAKEISNCTSATLFIVTDKQHARAVMCTTNSQLADADWPLYTDTGEPDSTALVPHCISGSRLLVVDDLRRDTCGYGRDDLERLNRLAALRIISTVVIPMKRANGQVIGLIQLNNARDPQTGETTVFDRKGLPYLEALAAQAAVAIENQQLLDAQKDLVDAFIKVIAGAIDAKSTYTGGHCARVPELALMLAEAACKTREGPLAAFEFKTEDEWREFRIGAWLHDCGKVTTPEYVVDKASKLETIFNRIHEVRTRFEVLLRDAQIERLTAIHERGMEAQEAEARFQSRKAELLDDFAFVAECNLGGEFMAPDRLERLRRIATRTWLRHFDDRLGLSHEELARYNAREAEVLPALETLLADKPHHIIPREASRSYDARFGFKQEVPEHLYNQGELYNLSVGRGTLTEEERFKINEHILQTIVMLECIPLPDNLKRIPEYAGTHHETLTGSGYPKKLTEDELSIPSRIMAIADIFEALTAADRPYKKPKSLSECVKILFFFKRDKHIDPVLFDLFLTSGVYRKYAEQHLRPDQIDEVEIGQFLG